MALQYSVPVNNARLDAVETATGASAKLHIYTGAPPANCAAAATGTKLLVIDLPADYMAAASNGTKVKAGTWTGSAIADGVGGYFRIMNSTETTCHLQGTVGRSAADMILDNTNIAVTQVVTVNSFQLTASNT